MLSIKNIRTIAKYESKLLGRSWFFRMFTILALFITIIFSLLFITFENAPWMVYAVPSNIPYFSILQINLIQAIIAIFLSSEFLKRDKKLDTSEVFYIAPASNAEYVFGKIWGNIRMFIFLNLLVCAIVILFSLASDYSIDIMGYIVYVLLIIVPSLLFIMGLSSFLMLFLGSQSITFVILLTYIGVTLFYLDDKFNLLFDYMAYNLPLFKSDIIGFTHLSQILLQRGIYVFFGLAFIGLTITKFSRLSNSNRSKYHWMFFSIVCFVGAFVCGFSYMGKFSSGQAKRSTYLEVNDRWAQKATFEVLNYDIDFNCVLPNHQQVKADLKVISLSKETDFVFTLNPGYELTNVQVKQGAKKIKFVWQTDYQIIDLKFAKPVIPTDTLTLSFTYKGKADEDFSYLDVSEDERFKLSNIFMISLDKKYLFQEEDMLLLTPQNYWYPRAGVSYSVKYGVIPSTNFSLYNLKVRCKKGLVAVSQGASSFFKEGVYLFKMNKPIKSISVAVAKYKKYSITVDSIDYTMYYFKKNKELELLSPAKDTLSWVIRNNWLLRSEYNDKYPYHQFALVEVPAQFTGLHERYNLNSEVQQPGLIFFPENFSKLNYKIKQRLKDMRKRGAKYKNDTLVCTQIMNDFSYKMFRSEQSIKNDFSFSSNRDKKVLNKPNDFYLFPQVVDNKLNIYSHKWPIINDCISSYLKGEQSSGNTWYMTAMNGVSQNEQASLLLKDYSFKEILTNDDYIRNVGNVVSLMIRYLFAPCEQIMGKKEFKDDLTLYLVEHSFKNLQLSDLCNHVDSVCDSVFMVKRIADWDGIVSRPSYQIKQPDCEQLSGRDGDFYIVKCYITNTSDIGGYIGYNLQVHGSNRQTSGEIDLPGYDKTYFIPAHKTKEIVNVLEDRPLKYTINMGISQNLPMSYTKGFNKMTKEHGSLRDKDSELIVSLPDIKKEYEVVVDNEDSLLFSISKPQVFGIFPRMLQKEKVGQFKYKGFVYWNPPLNWIFNINDNYWGECMKSACVKKKGNGSQKATWKIPVPKKGRYDLYYYYYGKNNSRSRREEKGEYLFNVKYNGDSEDAYFKYSKPYGWRLLGTYNFPKDTVEVVLTDKTTLKYVIADAVKIVKKVDL